MRHAREAKEFYKLGRETYNNPIWLRLIELSYKRDVPAFIQSVNGGLKTVHGKEAAGQLRMYNNGQYEIVLDGNFPLYKLTKNLCHELGHYMIHRKLNHDQYKNDPGQWWKIEDQADEFADRLMRLLLCKAKKQVGKGVIKT